MLQLKRLVPIVAIALAACGGQGQHPNAASGPGQTQPVAKSSQQYVRFTDPAEGAFSMDVPVGWQVQGGMWRFGYFDARWMMTVRSLDGSMIVRVSDASIPPYALPGPLTGTQGQPYTRPKQFQMIVSDYRTGGEYARLYAVHRFRSVCQILALQGGAWTPAMRNTMADTTGATRVTEGSVGYSCQTPQGLRVAIVYARTLQYPTQTGNGFWVVAPVVSVLSVPHDLPTAFAVTQHMLDSWQKNPQWVAYQNRLTQVGLNQIMANYQDFLHEMAAYDQARRSAMDAQVAGFESRMNAQQEQVSQFGEILTGIQDATDPMTGEKLQVWTGPHANYYRNGMGVTLNSDLSPGPGFHQITTP
jgi:hypothetical protein